MKYFTSGLFWLAAVLLGLCGVVWLNPTFTVSLTEAQALAKVAERLPFQAIKGNIAFEVKESLTFTFRPDGRVAVSIPFTAKPTFTQVSHYAGTAHAIGKPVYAGGKLYVRELTDVRLQGDFVVSDRAKAVGGLVKGGLNRIGAKGTEGDTLLNPEALKAQASAFLESKLHDVPVYSLKPDKLLHQLAGATVQELKVADKTISIVFSARTLILKVLTVVSIVLLLVTGLYGMMLWDRMLTGRSWTRRRRAAGSH